MTCSYIHLFELNLIFADWRNKNVSHLNEANLIIWHLFLPKLTGPTKSILTYRTAEGHGGATGPPPHITCLFKAAAPGDFVPPASPSCRACWHMKCNAKVWTLILISMFLSNYWLVKAWLYKLDHPVYL